MCTRYRAATVNLWQAIPTALGFSDLPTALHLNYYLSGAVCAVCVCLSASVCEKLFLLYGFGEQTSRILEFKPKGLEG